MASVVHITGVEGIREAMRAANVKLGWRVRRGLIKAGLLLQRLSQEIVPVDTGNLKNSAGSKAIGHGWSTDVVVYYTAAYAVYVHENTMAAHGAVYNLRYPNRKSRGERQQAKFLETPARVHRDELLRVIAKEAGGTV